MASRGSRSNLCLGLAVFALLGPLAGCPTTTPPELEWTAPEGFDDHTVGRLETVAQFDQLAAAHETPTAALKFVIVEFGEKRQTLRWLDARFYEFHDQWYWFRLINGARVPGTREQPLDESFASVAEIADWVRSRKAPPPLGMRFVEDRLYSDYFYEISIRRERRAMGLGTLVHLPAKHPRPEIWGFELEYSDPVEQPELERFFAAIRATLPPEIAEQLQFIARSPAQERLVAQLRSRKHALGDRVTTYAELAVPGEIEVYNPGLVAGPLRRLPDDPELAAKLLTQGDPRVIWMLPAIPDELLPAAGLLTAVPQTPLAHVNLLARNRGIPNVYLGGLLDDPQLNQLARVHAPIVMLAEADGTLRLEPIREADYARWLGLAQARVPVIDKVDVRSLAYTLDLDAIALEHVPLLRTTAGGKSAGFPILREAKVETPERPLAITIRAYVEHLRELTPLIEAVLLDPGFQHDARVRLLLLEGREEFDQRFTSAADQAWLAKFVAAHPADKQADPIAQLIARDGVKQAIRDRPLDPAAAAALDQALRAQFGHFAPTQGLRFRSSSTVEDVEGFSGAGLYDSNTGFLDPSVQPDKADRKHDVEWALKKTWASYWSWEAFEERRMTGIDHLAGNMAVLVHARFDDAAEISNGVITLTLDTGVGDQRDTGDYATMEIDVQVGALSVTNPPPERAGEILPEVIRVTQHERGGPIVATRVATSTELRPGQTSVLTPAQIDALLRDCVRIAEAYLSVENRSLEPKRARRRITLDLEIREVAEGWPAVAGAAPPAQSRMILKQVRSLDPGIPPGAERLLSQPIPRELVLFADRIEQRTCRSNRITLELIEIWTDPMASPDLGHARVPYLARVRVKAEGVEGGPVDLELDHTQLANVAHRGMERGGAWALQLSVPGGAVLDSIDVTAGIIQLRGGRSIASEPAQCTSEVLFASPDGFLRSLL